MQARWRRQLSKRTFGRGKPPRPNAKNSKRQEILGVKGIHHRGRGRLSKTNCHDTTDRHRFRDGFDAEQVLSDHQAQDDNGFEVMSIQVYAQLGTGAAKP